MSICPNEVLYHRQRISFLRVKTVIFGKNSAKKAFCQIVGTNQVPESRNGISARDGYAVVRSWARERDQRSRAL